MSTTQDRLNDIGLEADYWKLALDDVLELHNLISDSADALGGVTVALLSITTAPPEHRIGFAADGMDGVSAALRRLQAMQPKVTGVVELVGGRLTVLEQAVAELARLG